MYSKIFNGQSVSVDPSNITIGLSKYPTRNITAVHIIPCPGPASWAFAIKNIFVIVLCLCALIGLVKVGDGIEYLGKSIWGGVMLNVYFFIFFLVYIARQPKFNALTFGNATDQPVLIVSAFTYGEYFSLVFGGDTAAFNAETQKTCAPLIEFRDEIEKSINELQKT